MDYAALRHRMVQQQLRRRGISDERLLAVMEDVPRHLFLPERLRDRAYEDGPLPIAAGQTISQPYIVARMTELLALTGTETVLEVGTGSGYQAAVLGRLTATVWTIERHEDLSATACLMLAQLGIDNVRCVVGDGTLGLPQAAPFDAIIVTAGGPGVPQALREQLKPGGRMVIPIAGLDAQDLLLVEKVSVAEDALSAAAAAPEAHAGPEETRGGLAGGAVPCRFRETVVLGCVFVPLVGEQGYPA
jgi:protein-L-isoaspartate(D-aspartate) O-methyltransferase